MKKMIFILLLIIAGSAIIIQAGPSQKPTIEKKSAAATESVKKTEIKAETEKESAWKGHDKQSIDCKMCHTCEYPVKGDPCLGACPKGNAISVYHKPEEGPEIVYMDDIKGKEGYAIFSHKMHAEMAEMSGRCSNCHHYNTTGPVLKCSKCHEANRQREDLSKPDLKGAYHRQCMSCHRQWQGKVECESCHVPDGQKGEAKKKAILAELTGKSHPKMQEPDKIVWETKYQKGKVVTFFHDEHVKIFNLECVSCHKNDNCTKCHNPATAGHLIGQNKPVKVHKSFDEHHKPCSSCHASDTKNNCSKCHSGSEAAPFDHGKKTGFPLFGYHAKASCDKCHGNNGKFTKLDNNCTSCHKNFVNGKFNHKVTGLALDENHADADCESCHNNKKFNANPKCDGCHDDKSFPKFLPGKRMQAR